MFTSTSINNNHHPNFQILLFNPYLYIKSYTAILNVFSNQCQISSLCVPAGKPRHEISIRSVSGFMGTSPSSDHNSSAIFPLNVLVVEFPSIYVTAESKKRSKSSGSPFRCHPRRCCQASSAVRLGCTPDGQSVVRILPKHFSFYFPSFFAGLYSHISTSTPLSQRVSCMMACTVPQSPPPNPHHIMYGMRIISFGNASAMSENAFRSAL